MPVDIAEVTQLVFYHSAIRGKFTTSAEPTLEGTTAIDSINRSVADGGQVPDIFDGSRQGLLTAEATGLITGDDSTFDSAGNWTNLDANVSIAGGLLVFNGVTTDDGAELLAKVQAGVSYYVTFTTSGVSSGGVKAVLGGTAGATRTTADTFSQIITAGSANTKFEFKAAGIPSIIDMDNVTCIPLDFRFDMPMDERIDVDTLIVDNNGLRKSFGSDERNAVALHHHTSDVFGSATQLTPTGGYARILGQELGYISLDGMSDDVVISDDPDLDVALGDFSIAAWVYRDSTTSNLGIVSKNGFNNSSYLLSTRNNGYRLEIKNSGGGTTQVDDTTGANTGVWEFVVATADRDGNGVIYVNGIVNQTTDISARDGDDLSNAADFIIGARTTSADFFDGRIAGVQFWNRVLSVSEALAFFDGTIRQIAVADQWGNQTDITPTGQAWSDSNTEGNSVGELTETLCAISSVTAAGETPAATHAGTRMVKMALASGSSYCGDSFSTVIGKKYRASGWCYVPTGTGGFTQLRVGTSLNNNDLGSESYTTRDAWVYVQVEYTATTTTTYISSLNSAPSGNMYVDDVVNVQIGAVAEWRPDGLRPTTNEWIDASTNNLDATVSGAEYKRSPDANKNGVLILKYASVNARYWYVTVNDEQDTAPNADLELGEITLAKSFQPSVNPNVNASETQDYSGIDEVQKYGGGIDLNERHGRRRIWTFTWDYLTSADKANFQLMLEQTKKRILYFTLNNDAAFPVLYGARILEAVDINVLNYQAYGLSLTLIEEV